MTTRLGALLTYCWRAFVRRDEPSRYLLAELATRFIYPKYAFSEYGRLFLEDHEFIALHRRYQGANRHALDRAYTLRALATQVAGVPGDSAECGAYTGASSHVICQALAGTGKRHHVFDSFAGLSAPGGEDGGHWRQGDLAAPEAAIRANLAGFPFVDYHVGWIPERFPEVADRRFCFLHLDVDLHQPTLDALRFFYPLLSPGAIVVCDDHGFTTCPGARLAMDTFFADKPERVGMLPSGQALVIKR